MKILLCLLSDQHVPNLLVVHSVKPDRLVLIETKGMNIKKAVDNFLNALKLGGLDYSNDKHEILKVEKENSMNEIQDKIKECYEKRASNEWIINLTGGTKPMVLGAFNFFKDKNVKMLYLAAANQKEILNLLEDKKEMEITHKTSVSEFLAGYGFEAKVGDTAWEKRGKKWFDFSKYIVLHCEDKEIIDYLAKFSNEKAQEKGMQLKNEPLHDIKFSEYMRNLFGIEMKGNMVTGNLDKHMCKFLAGRWLEVFLYNILNKYKEKLGIWDVHIELSIFANKNKLPNELDITFMKDQMLYLVECKTGGQLHDKEVNALYKTEAIKKQFGALKVKSIFATTSDNIIDDKKNIKEHIQNRARIYDCTILTRADIKELAEKLDKVKDEEFVDLINKKFGFEKKDFVKIESKPIQI